jgi:hypothetical protein
MEVIVAFLASIVIARLSYQRGRRTGARERLIDMHEVIRRRIRESLIEPWEEQFEHSFMADQAYEVNEQTLDACLALARELYQIQTWLPVRGVFDIEEGPSFAESVTHCRPQGWASPMLDPYWGMPTGYVDAFLEILRSTGGEAPSTVWLNRVTGAIALRRAPDEEYLEIRLSDQAHFSRPGE